MPRPPIKKRKQKEAENGEDEDDEDDDEEDEAEMKAAFKKSVSEDKKLHKAVGKVAKKVGVRPPADD